jgi:hypothetical protein
MHGYFTFEVRPPDEPKRAMVLFCATSTPTADAVISAVKKYGDDTLSPDCILIVGLESEKTQIESIAQDERLKDTLPAHTRQVTPPPIHVGVIPRFGLRDDDVMAASHGGLFGRQA